MKIKNLLCLFLMVAFMAGIYILLQQNYTKTTEKTNDNKKEDISSEYDWLIEEGKNAVIKEEILKYLKNDGEYVVQGRLNHNGYTYKSIQINMVEHEHKLQTDKYALDIISILMLKNEKYKEEILKELEESKQAISYEEGCREYDKFRQSNVTEYISDVSKRIEIERGKEFDLIEKWCITALVKYDKEGSVADIIVYEGAIGGKLLLDNEKIVWDLCIAENMLYDYWSMYDQNNEKKIAGHGAISGTVYKLGISSEFDINNIEYIRKTHDNDFYQLDADVIYNRPLGNVYVKNFELTLDDIKNNKDLKKLVYKNRDYISDDVRTEFRELIGYEHLYTHLYDGIYFTTDGYIVLMARPAKYVKMTPQEFSKVDYYNWYSCFTEFLYEEEEILYN